MIVEDINQSIYKQESHIQTKSGYIEEKPEYKQIVNITKYSTPGEGFIDRKAAPGIAVANDESIHHTNHSDEAPGLVIQFNNNDREITGSVWDDTNNAENDDQTYKAGDGIYNDKGVKDVIVQLVELKEVTAAGKTKQFEYIWQETKTGSNEVQSLKLNGETVGKYPVQNAGDGDYTFKAFPPGYYIVRYIYGDGSTYSVTPNVRTYNGNDYQSTVDARYNNPNFDYSYNDNGTRNNDARDNEARRLEVMEKTALVNNEIGTKLDAIRNNGIADTEQLVKEGLDMTWMCAETSIMDITFEDYEEITNNGNYPEREIEGNEEIVKPAHYHGNIAKLDFGLQLRPVNVLELEKHLVGLNITVDGVGPILDARIAEEDEDDKVEGIGDLEADYGKDDLMIIGAADRKSRGQWYFQTNTDELARGAELEATYRYIVHNKGEIDYLSKALVDKYTKEGETIADYKKSLVSEYDEDGEVAKGLAYEVKTALKNWRDTGRNINYEGTRKAYAIGDYLGATYYTGNTGGANVAEVPARAEIIEEALNNQLSFNVDSGGQAGVAFEKVAGIEGGSVNRVVYNTDGSLVTEQINTIVKTVAPTNSLTVKQKDNRKEIVLTRALNTTNVEEELLYDSYIAEIYEYSNAAGRRDAGTIGEYPKIDKTEAWDGSEKNGAVPGQLRNTSKPTDNAQIVTPSASNPSLGAGYVHSNAGEHTLEAYNSPTGGVKLANEHDEFWAESIKITKPTGVTDEVQTENNVNMAVIIGIPALIVLAGAIVLIIKFVIIKK
jgi:hypothetical protein